MLTSAEAHSVGVMLTPKVTTLGTEPTAYPMSAGAARRP
jgi:hypothetical protein